MGWQNLHRLLNSAPSDSTLAVSGNVTVAGTQTVTGATTFTGAQTLTGATALNGNVTVAAAKTLAVTDADKLTVNSVIVPQFVEHTYQWSIATQMVSSSLFIAPRAMKLVGATFVYGVQAGQACKVLVEKCTGTTAPGSGTGLLTNNTNTGFDANTTANTVQTGTLTATAADLAFAAGDRVSVKWGTSTSCVGAVLTLRFQYV